MRVEKKGSSVEFNSEVIIITTPFSPTQSYVISDEDVKQLTRRITKVFSYPLNAEDSKFLEDFLEDIKSI